MSLTTMQKKCIALEVEHPEMPLIKVAEMMGKHYQTIYAWNRLDEFQEALDKELHKSFKAGSKAALNKVLNIIETGRDQDALAAAKFILENSGYKQADQVQIGTSNDITIKINE